MDTDSEKSIEGTHSLFGKLHLNIGNTEPLIQRSSSAIIAVLLSCLLGKLIYQQIKDKPE